MHIFVTGATGYIGQAVSQRLLQSGHVVSGLVRSESGAKALRARGITPVLGGLDDSSVLREAALAADAVIDTATADHAESTQVFLTALEGTGKKFIRTSGTGIYTDLAQGELNPTIFTEEVQHSPAEIVATRYATDLAVIDAASRGIHTVVLRPSMIFGDGASEQLPLLIRQAITSGRSLYVGRGDNRWSNVYIADLAEAYFLALHKAPAGSAYNLAAGEARMGDIAERIARLVGLQAAESCTPEVAYEALGQRWVDVAISSNSRVDSAKARTELGWSPAGPDLLDDLGSGSYKRIWAYKGDPHDHVQAVASDDALEGADSH
ncbi:NAD-dependent epimerase/dehydratase family protein [Paenarthrobacter sp. TYUT067]|uniref:NAD-dependent epimerase/dehydratase family protein n=1 Tax=Paenarthrobacter sp. TYUT067 TaxID=2926245 RepID=UPI00202E2641|nr:NAD-dependent epimerase/dehydratase family protein [Paenarthrobacter sp. TYUT067]MCM0614461.1 NAD-dependent epimerase/dehydratase family protein [Paenarthrobacter sp. TYUT067]